MSKTTDNQRWAIDLQKQTENWLAPIGMNRQRTRYCNCEEDRKVVSMVFRNPGLAMPTWHVRVKAGAEVSLDDVATEVGIAQGFRNRVVLVAGTGKVSQQARRYAAQVTRTTAFQVMVLDGRDLASARLHPARFAANLQRQAPFALVR